MSDLTDDDIHYASAADTVSEVSLVTHRAIARELIALRAACAADAERVRSVVIAAVDAETVRDPRDRRDFTPSTWSWGFTTAIADRVAEQLAGARVGLSDDEVAALDRANQLIVDTGGMEESERALCKIIWAHRDRLLASPPAPDLHSAICALLDSDMPAGDLRKALAELVGRR